MRILIVEVNWLGDVLFSTPAIKAIKKKFPDSFISCLCVPRVKEMIELNPNVDEIIINDEEFRYRGFWGRLRLAKELKDKKFDLVILFHRSATRAAVAWLCGIPRRIGYAKLRQKLFLSEPLPMPKKDSLHRVDYYLGITEYLGCDIQDRFYEFFTSDDDEKSLDKYLEQEGISLGGFTVCLNPGGNWNPKRWPKENFSRLADRLINDYKIKVVFTGSKGDIELISEIRKNMAYEPIVCAGKINLKQLACLFRKVNLVISADSGPLHIAASQGTGVIALFGPTSHLITGPIGKGKIKIIRKDSGCAIPCYDAKCKDNICMRNITVKDVVAQVEDFLNRNNT